MYTRCNHIKDVEVKIKDAYIKRIEWTRIIRTKFKVYIINLLESYIQIIFIKNRLKYSISNLLTHA